MNPKRNPNFGKGALRRRIRLLAETNAVRAGVEDSYHSFRLVLRHDGVTVSDVVAEAVRYPLSTCPGATSVLRQLVGASLSWSRFELTRHHNPSSHRTHLHDLAFLAMTHARRGGVRQFDVEVPDEHPDPVWSRVTCDGQEAHRWQTFEGRILAPSHLAGRPLLRGFSAWASKEFTGDLLEAAWVLHKGYFVSRARSWDVEADAGQSVAHHRIMAGKCYSYSPAVMPEALRMAGTTLDTSHHGVELLPDLC